MAEAVSGKCNLIINYLPQSLSDKDFHDLFEGIGRTTSTRIIRDKFTNYSYGYGFVVYEKSEDAAKAIEQLNGHNMEHKKIKVAYSQPSSAQTKNINLHVTGLPQYVDDNALKKVFEPYGTIVQCRTVKNKTTNFCQGFGFVLYTKKEEALSAMKALNGTLYEGTEGNVLSVKFAKTEQKGPPTTFLKKQMDMLSNVYNGLSNTLARVQGGGGGGPMRAHSIRGRFSPMAGRGFGMMNRSKKAQSLYNDQYYSGMNDQQKALSSFNMNMSQANSYGASKGTGDASYQTPAKETIVFVYGIGPNADENTLWQMFGPYGNIVRVNVLWDHDKGTGKGYGFVTYSSLSEAMYAIEDLNGAPYEGRTLQVSIKTDVKS